MALDRVRNEAYAAALRAAVRADSVVLDLGAGIGVHGLMAARLGAKRVYLVEPEDIIVVAEETVRANGLQDRVVCLQGRIEDVKLPEPVDIIVSVLTGNFLLTEDLLGSLFHARDTVLAPGGVLIPDAAVMEVVPVEAPELHTLEIGGWSEPQAGIDTGVVRAYAANSVFFRSDGVKAARWLAEPQDCHAVDFSTDAYAAVDVHTHHEIATAGLCHGWVGWFRMKLGEQWLSTSPQAAPVHWSSAFFPLDPPLMFKSGERVSFALTRAPRGDWTWRIQSDAGSQQHSTVLSLPLGPGTLIKASKGYAPALSAEGRAVLHVLSRFDGVADVATIARVLRDDCRDRFLSDAEALTFVQRLARQLAR